MPTIVFWGCVLTYSWKKFRLLEEAFGRKPQSSINASSSAPPKVRPYTAILLQLTKQDFGKMVAFHGLLCLLNNEVEVVWDFDEKT